MSTCSKCGTVFSCAMADGLASPCWCTQLPPLPAPDFSADCYCARCLREAVASAMDSGAAPSPAAAPGDA